MNILLGVFGSKFWEMTQRLNAVSFSSDWPRLDVNEYSLYSKGIINHVHGGCQLADIIYFDLTYIRFEFSSDSFEKSVTLNELLLVITTPELLEKTIFIKRNKTLNKEEIVNKLLFNPYWNQYLN